MDLLSTISQQGMSHMTHCDSPLAKHRKDKNQNSAGVLSFNMTSILYNICQWSGRFAFQHFSPGQFAHATLWFSMLPGTEKAKFRNWPEFCLSTWPANSIICADDSTGVCGARLLLWHTMRRTKGNDGGIQTMVEHASTVPSGYVGLPLTRLERPIHARSPGSLCM